MEEWIGRNVRTKLRARNEATATKMRVVQWRKDVVGNVVDETSLDSDRFGDFNTGKRLTVSQG